MADAPPPILPDVPVLGLLRPDAQALVIAEMGDHRVARANPDAPDPRPAPDNPDADARGGGLGEWLGVGGPWPWQYTTHQIGFVPPAEPGSRAPIQVLPSAAVVPADELKDGRVDIHLDRLGVFDYPGAGGHTVLFTFKAQTQLPGGLEPVAFSQVYKVQAGSTAGVKGYPLCVGLGVGKLGVAFQFNTVNVKSTSDDAVSAVLESPAFAAGLNLLGATAPGLKPMSDLAVGVARQFAKRRQNQPVQDCYLGLDFGPAAFGCRLAVGNYVAVQVPGEGALNWDEWQYVPDRESVRHKATGKGLEYNHLVFRVSRHAG